MDRKDAREEVIRNWRTLIAGMTSPARQRVNGETSWICPICGHGAHGDGLTFNRKSNAGGLKCFGCGFGGNIIDLYMQVNSVDYQTALADLAGQLGIEADGLDAERTQRPKIEPKGRGQANHHPAAEKAEFGPQDRAQADYTSYYHECAGRIGQAADYLRGRGISRKIADAYHIGYDPGERRVIIPVTESFYIARAAAGQEPRYKNPAGQKTQIFNTAALYAGNQAVFVTEGAFDALSVVECGHAAIALNSTSNAGQLISLLRDRPTKATLILCLDNDGPDGPGQTAQKELAIGLDQLKAISYITADITGRYKDANEILTADRPALVKALAAAEREAQRSDSLQSFLEADFLDAAKKYEAGGKKTGFEKWDALTNGLNEGIYMLAAMPGAGKTTLAWQMCENLAAAGEDVLFFELEQTTLDLATKSIMRRIKIDNMDTCATMQLVKDGTIDTGDYRARIVREVGARIHVIEGNFSLSAQDVCDRIDQHVIKTGRTPVVFIDYLQALKPLEDKRRTGNREAIEDTVDLLSRTKNKYGLTMVIVSSVSRASYRAMLDVDALKESGRLEYSADAIWTLEYSVIYGREKELFESDGDISKKKQIIRDVSNKIPCDVSLSCIKSRYGGRGARVDFKLYGDAGLFVEEKEGGFDPVQASETPFDKARAVPFNPRRK